MASKPPARVIITVRNGIYDIKPGSPLCQTPALSENDVTIIGTHRKIITASRGPGNSFTVTGCQESWHIEIK